MIQTCPLRGACPGGANDTCATEWTGELCAQCSSQAYRTRALDCTHCSHFALLQLAGASGSVVIFITCVLKFSASQNALFTFKVTLNHFQMISALSYLRLAYSPILSYALHGVMYLSSWLIPDMPLACLGWSAELSKAVIGSALLPVFSSAIAILHCLNLLTKKQVIVLLTSACFFIPPICLQAILPLLVCWNTQSGARLLLHIEMECWVGTHDLLIYALFIPTMLVCVLAPFLLALIWGCLRRDSFRSYFPLWTSGYAWTLWDLFFYLTKVALLSVIITTMSTGQLVQITATLAVLIFIACINVASSSAFTTKREFVQAQASILVVALSTGFLSYYLYSDPGEGKTEWFSVSAVLLLNCVFLLLVALLSIPTKMKHVLMQSDFQLRPPANSFA